MRVPGDVLFATGIGATVTFILGVGRRGEITHVDADAVDPEPAPAE